LGKISKEQRAGEFTVWKTGLTNANYADFANSCGAMAFKIDKKNEEDLEKYIQSAIDYDGFSVVEVITAAELI
jgi:thiamine pyrophosphate-dependent acetolactate synthase large subunit-like protein